MTSPYFTMESLLRISRMLILCPKGISSNALIRKTSVCPPTTTSSLILTDLSSVAVLSSADICNASKAGRGDMMGSNF